MLGRGPKKPVVGDVVFASNGDAALSVGVHAPSDDEESGSDRDIVNEHGDDPLIREVVMLTDEEPVEEIDHRSGPEMAEVCDVRWMTRPSCSSVILLNPLSFAISLYLRCCSIAVHWAPPLTALQQAVFDAGYCDCLPTGRMVYYLGTSSRGRPSVGIRRSK